MTWKARSQAAYQGYSHLSGIEMMSPLYMWCHWSLRGANLRTALKGSEPRSSSHLSTS